MKPKKVRVPKPYLHKPSGQDVVVLRDADGRRRTVYLGRHGSAEAANRYRDALAAHFGKLPLETARKPKPRESEWPTVGQLAAAYLLHARSYYVNAAGEPTGEVEHASIAYRQLLALHCDTPTDQIRVRDLHGVRQRVIEYRPTHKGGRQAPNGLSRTTINQRMQRVKALFRWGVERGYVPGAVWHELSAFRGIPKGRAGVHDNPPVVAVPWALVESTLSELVPTIRDAVLVQWWCGCRPAEVISMTRGQIDMSGEVWTYEPKQHKGLWRGKERVIALGPNAQKVLAGRIRLDPDAPVFSGRDAWTERRGWKRARRRTLNRPGFLGGSQT